MENKIKIFQLVGCLDEGVSYSWLFKAKSEWHVAKYMIENHFKYPDLFNHLGLDPFSG